MDYSENYPRLKVFMGFVFCPSFIISCYLLLSLFMAFLLNNEMFDISLETIRSKGLWFLVMFLFLIFSGQISFLPPSLLLGTVACVLEIDKTPKNLILMSVLGGVFAALWAIVFSAGDRQQGSIFLDSWGLFSGRLSFLLGMLASFFIGLIVLPKKKM
jgi:hypothetical protein